MVKLSSESVKLLREIIEHRDENGNCNSQYWKDRFEKLSVSEDALLRSSFKELREAEMVSVNWGDDYPYLIFLLAKGKSYFDEKENQLNNGITNTFTNNFFGSLNGVQIQQGTTHSVQSQTINMIDDEKLIELINLIKKYDKTLDQEFGVEGAAIIRKSNQELEMAVVKNDTESNKRKILNIIKDLAVNVIGGVISGAIVNLITTL